MVVIMVLVRMMFVLMVVIVMMVVMISMVVVMFEMDVELGAADLGFLAAGEMEVVAVQPQFSQLQLELLEIHAEVEQRADEHVATDAAENVQV